MEKYASLMVLVAAVLWGSNGVFVKLLEGSGLGGFEMSSMRMILTLIIEFILVLFTDRKLFRIRKKDIFWFMLTGTVGIYAFVVAYSLSIQYVGMATAAVLIYLMPSLVLIYSCLFMNEKINLFKIISVILSLVGCALACGVASGIVFNVKGILLGLLTAFCYAANNILLSTKLKDYAPLTRVFYTAVAAAICSLIYLCLFTNVGEVLSIYTHNVRYLVIDILWAICCSVAPFYLFNASLKYIGVAKASLLSTFEPVSAALIGIFVFHEHWDIFTISGIILVVVSIIICEKASEN
ncbi:MAG: EamA family transporter [Erysipelotrichaceae bacterium]|nr:EamA family transporter [Erysipelotrichaceae bacterium]